MGHPEVAVFSDNFCFWLHPAVWRTQIVHRDCSSFTLHQPRRLTTKQRRQYTTYVGIQKRAIKIDTLFLIGYDKSTVSLLGKGA